MRKTFRTLADARAWRAEAQTATRHGLLRAPTRVTLEEAARDWCAAAAAGVVRTRGGDRYKPSALRSYEQSLRTHVLPRLGHEKVSAVSRTAIQDMVDEMVAAECAASTTRNAVLPLRAIYRRAVARAEVMVNPTLGLALPAVRTRRERVARPEEAAALIASVPARDRALWATALYAGLRRGELMALRWEDVDFDAGLIRVERGWDQAAGPIEPKSRAGRRRVPMAQPLRAHLAAHRLAQGAAGELVFARQGGQPFGQAVVNRAKRAWREAGTEGIGLHECRHTYAAFMIAAGVNAKALSSYMGHSSIVVTLDRYGHLMPGNEQEAADLLGAYLKRNSR
ncbi:MAG TPA: tyrosine-type recombinase/integrase [Solirubrobacteraceae bacterium]